MPNPLLFPVPEPEPSELEKALEVTLEDKRARGLLGPEQAALVQLCRELARSIAAGAATAKTSVPQAAQQLMTALESLPKPPETAADDALAAAMRAEADR